MIPIQTNRLRVEARILIITTRIRIIKVHSRCNFRKLKLRRRN